MNQTDRSNDSELSAEDLASTRGGKFITTGPLLPIGPFRLPPLFPKPPLKPSIWDLVRRDALAAIAAIA